MTMPGSCAIAVVLDRSGSMESIREATIDGFNEFLRGQQAAPGEASLTLAQFDHEYDVVCNGQRIATVEPLTNDSYVPRGTTALLDALGRTINELGARLAAMEEHNRPSRVLFAIITDGMENASREFTRSQIFQMITHQREKYSWEFLFLAANQDAIASGRDFGIDPSFAASFRASAVSSRKAFRMASEKMAMARRSSARSAPFSAEERSELMSNDDSSTHSSSPATSTKRTVRRSGKASTPKSNHS